MPGEQSSVTDLLYFGTAKPNGVVTLEEWAAFLATSVTPRFPTGLTVWQASGQWTNENGDVVHEGAFVLSLVHPDDHSSETAVRALTAEYKSRFNQRVVLVAAEEGRRLPFHRTDSFQPASSPGSSRSCQTLGVWMASARAS
jgi:Protein of unknown function (DUF3574)